jgi:hypothetical protein
MHHPAAIRLLCHPHTSAIRSLHSAQAVVVRPISTVVSRFKWSTAIS